MIRAILFSEKIVHDHMTVTALFEMSFVEGHVITIEHAYIQLTGHLEEVTHVEEVMGKLPCDECAYLDKLGEYNKSLPDGILDVEVID